ncbi:hypothetical protein MHI57_18055 [Cytobacillus sp. FSL K6-0129]|uniref:hypothetical protein n=1 Tax=Cytobacillus sp. FSL K6-0129 TaxID=2921421 RepID=UPI0030F85770
MTTILTYANSNFSIMLVDKRLNIGLNQENGYSDDGEKLKEIGFSLASGSGLYEVANNIINYILTDVPKGISIDESYKNTINQLKIGNPRLKDSIDGTIVMINSFDESIQKFRTSRLGFDTVKTLENDLINIIYPSDLIHVKENESAYNVNIKTDNLAEVLWEMLNIFKVISEESKFVSSDCDLGVIQFLDSAPAIFRKTNHIDSFLEDIQNGNL